MNSDLATFIDTLPYTMAEEQLVGEGAGRGRGWWEAVGTRGGIAAVVALI